MDYKSLIVFLTDSCRAECRTCNVSAKSGNSVLLNKSDLDLLFGNAHLMNSVEKYLVWTGGEPFENFPVLKHGIELAEKSGFLSEILTSGYWYKKGSKKLPELIHKGHFTIRLSLDAEHMKFINKSDLLELIGECLTFETDINFTIRELPGNEILISEFFNDLKRFLPDFVQKKGSDPRWIHYIPHVPVLGDDPYRERLRTMNKISGCKMAGRDLVVGWDGMIYQCCGLFSLPRFRKFATGNIDTKSERGMISGRSGELFRIIKEVGPQGIFNKLGIKKDRIGKDGFINQCEACLFLFREFSDEVDKFFSL